MIGHEFVDISHVIDHVAGGWVVVSDCAVAVGSGVTAGVDIAAGIRVGASGAGWVPG